MSRVGSGFLKATQQVRGITCQENDLQSLEAQALESERVAPSLGFASYYLEKLEQVP